MQGNRALCLEMESLSFSIFDFLGGGVCVCDFWEREALKKSPKQRSII